MSPALLHWRRAPTRDLAHTISSTLAACGWPYIRTTPTTGWGARSSPSAPSRCSWAGWRASWIDLSWSGERLPPTGGARYAVGAGVELVPLPYYRRLSEPWAVLRSSIQSAARFWRALRGVDGVWLLGPHPLAIAFAALAAVRRRRVVLGVRQDTRAYVESRHPGRRSLRLAAALLTPRGAPWPAGIPVVVVGPEIAAHYARARVGCSRSPSPWSRSATSSPWSEALRRPYEDELRVISVGRLEAEKNPLLLADVWRDCDRTAIAGD